VQTALGESFQNYKTIILLIVEVFWNENNQIPIELQNEFKDDYENTFSNKDEVKHLIQRFKFDNNKMDNLVDPNIK